ncbi:hypothetical protein LWI29_036296 [Acer saccharum]|uniref:Uncharacterized protein n=1 Tax=Acer saccharum TaxID=4024 RepID=A0AA39SB62_ACESA|nr:hypothetical protein LWI29_036296 [Acer saccharum]
MVKDKSTIPNVGIEASQGVPANTQPNPVLKSNEEDDNQGTLRDLITRERHSKNRSDYLSKVRVPLSSDQARVANQIHPLPPTSCSSPINCSDDSLAEIGIDDFDDASDHLLNHANKILMCSGQLSRTSLEVDMSVSMGGIVMGQTDDANIGQPNVITSRAAPEVVAPTIQCRITQAKGVVGIQGTLVATAATSIGAYETRLKLHEVTKDDALRRSLENSKTRAFLVSVNVRELNMKNSNIEVKLARVELKCTHFEQRAILAEKNAAQLEERAWITKEIMANAQHSMLKS